MAQEQAVEARVLKAVQRTLEHHWVGDGFPVQTLFSYHELGPALSPFLLLDHAGPVVFPPTSERLGVGEHPHRGFETVTIVYEGEVEHRDSSGGGGKIGPGDVQWMTAGAGLVHEEFHGRDFARRGGRFEMVQLWVNLPAKMKMSPPRYQAIENAQIPEVSLPGGTGSVRVIAGAFESTKGPAMTFTPIQVWDLRLTGGRPIGLTVPDRFTVALVVLKGSIKVPGEQRIEAGEVGVFHRSGTKLIIDEAHDATALLLCGEPIDEPIAGSGPFVMNTREELRQAISDYQTGKMGRLS